MIAGASPFVPSIRVRARRLSLRQFEMSGSEHGTGIGTERGDVARVANLAGLNFAQSRLINLIFSDLRLVAST